MIDRRKQSRVTILLGSLILLLSAAKTGRAQDLNGIWTCDDGGIYYLRTVGDEVFWYGERGHATNTEVGQNPNDPPALREALYIYYHRIVLADFANIFHGHRTGNDIIGRWYDVPKGETQGQGDLHLRLEVPTAGGASDFPVLRKVSGSGFGGGRCSFGDNRSRHIGAEFMPAGFQSRGHNLTGTWVGDDGGTYYIRDTGALVVWYGESAQGGGAGFANVFSGAWRGGSFSGRWADVPKGRASTGTGELQIRRVNNFTLEKIGGAGSRFGATKWQRVESFYVDIFLRRFEVVRADDPSGSDEPTVYFTFAKLDGHTMDVTGRQHTLTNEIRPGGAWEHSLHSGQADEFVMKLAYYRTLLQTVRGVDPASPTARSYTHLAVITFAEEKDSAGDRISAQRAWERSLLTFLGGSFSPPTEPDYPTIARNARRAFVRALGGGIDTDEAFSTDTRVIRWSDFTASVTAGRVGEFYLGSAIPLEFNLRSDTGHYRIRGDVTPLYRGGAASAPRPW